ncbi:hypothetical protein ACWDA3_26100 [Nonomuraea rubra]
MPKMVLTAAFVSLSSTDLSEWANKIELQTEVEEKDVTTYKSLGWKEILGGLKSGSLGLEFKQDFAATELDDIMWPWLGQIVPFVVRADQGSASTSNPSYTGNCLVKGWNPLTGSVGDEASVSVSFPTSGAVTRTTA